MIDFDDDNDELLSDDDFGVSVYHNGKRFNVIFFEQYDQFESVGYSGAESLIKAFLTKSSNPVYHDDQIKIGSTEFIVRNIESRGENMMMVFLNDV